MLPKWSIHSDPTVNTSAPICLYYIKYGKEERRFTGKPNIDSNCIKDSRASNHFNYQAVKWLNYFIAVF